MLGYIREVQSVPKQPTRKSKSCQNNKCRRGASYNRLQRTVLFTVPLISQRTVRGLPISKEAGTVCSFCSSRCVLQGRDIFFSKSKPQNKKWYQSRNPIMYTHTKRDCDLCGFFWGGKVGLDIGRECSDWICKSLKVNFAMWVTGKMSACINAHFTRDFRKTRREIY